MTEHQRTRLPAWLATLALVAGAALGGCGGSPGAGPPRERAATAPASEAPSFDAATVADAVAHHVAPDPRRPAELVSTDDAYEARFHAGGMTLRSPEGPQAFDLALDEVRRGGTSLALRPGPWRGEGNVAERPVAPDVVERVTAREDEVEWDLVLAAPPPGRGDLAVTATVAGAEHVDVGPVVVRDAAGAERFRARPRVEGGRLTLGVPARVLQTSSYPLTVDPVVRPERFVSPTPAPGRQEVPDVATDGTDFLVVWTDGRSPQDSAVIAARVTAAGDVLDPTGIVVSQAPGSQAASSVAFAGGRYLVTWLDRRSEAAGDVYAARVAGNGTVLDPDGIPVSTAALTQTSPSVAAVGGEWFVAWSSETATFESDILGTKVAADGAVAVPGGLVLDASAGRDARPRVAFDGTRLLVVWSADLFGGDVDAVLVSTTGQVLPPGTIHVAVNPEASTPEVAAGGGSFLVVWDDGTVDAGDVVGARVAPDGEVLDPDGIPVATAPGNQFQPDLAFDGDAHLVVWSDDRLGGDDLFGARVDPSGDVLATGLALSVRAEREMSPAVAFAGDRHLLAWDNGPGGATGDVFAVPVNRSGSLLRPPALVSRASNIQRTVAVSRPDAAGTSLVVWADDRSGTAKIVGARVTSSGSVLDPAGISIGGSGAAQAAPTVDRHADGYLVAWHEGPIASSDIRGARLDRDGHVLGSTITISAAAGAQAAPTLVSDGDDDSLAVWADRRSGGADLYGTRIEENGNVVQPEGVPVITGTRDQAAPALVRLTFPHLLLVWQEGALGSSDVLGARLNTLLAPTAQFPVSTAPGDQAEAAVASRGSEALVVWHDRRNGADDVYGARVDDAGTVLDGAATGIPISTAAGTQQFPSVGFNGSWLVAWRDRRSGNDDVYGARVGTDGSVADPNGFPVAASGTAESPPAVGRAAADWVVAYPRAFEAGTGVFLRSVTPGSSK